MKSLLSFCTFVVIAASQQVVYGQVTYDSDGSIVLPNNKMAAGPGGAVSYNSEGGIVLPNQHMAVSDGYVEMPFHINKGFSGDGKLRQQAQGGITYNNEGGIVLPNNLAMAANKNNKGGSGITYNSDGGIVLPNQMAAADGYVQMPYHMNKGGSNNTGGSTNRGGLRQASSQGGSGITYNSEGGIVLPNSMAQQSSSGGGYNQGTGTFYDVEARVPTCGMTASNKEMVVALNAKQMGEDRSSKNQNCGKKVEIAGPSGQTVQAEVIDFCMTCDDGGLDMSPAVFEKVADFSTQSTDIKWKLIN
ncbi:hypothetical protein INT45_004436 [Circinella minor]|uniref:Uncharacterized protein n=1 Tax=Circinella minor TaxID=1195481 RepID=A0A8H7S3K7_9FUNG|nr:hypothetical protein INT45_004436 [Circinella minor]